MDLEAIHQGIVTVANNLPVTVGSVTRQLQVLPAMPKAITPPALVPVEFSHDYHQTFSGGSGAGMTAIDLVLGLFTSLGDSDSGRQMLLAYLAEKGSSSVLQVLEANKTLGGACATLVVKRVRGAYRLYEVSAAQYLGAMIEMKVYAT